MLSKHTTGCHYSPLLLLLQQIITLFSVPTTINNNNTVTFLLLRQIIIACHYLNTTACHYLHTNNNHTTVCHFFLLLLLLLLLLKLILLHCHWVVFSGWSLLCYHWFYWARPHVELLLFYANFHSTSGAVMACCWWWLHKKCYTEIKSRGMTHTTSKQTFRLLFMFPLFTHKCNFVSYLTQQLF